MTVCMALGVFKIHLRGKPVHLLLMAVSFMPVCYFTCETLGIRSVSVSEGSTIIACTPVVITLFSRVFLKEIPGKRRVAGVVLTTCGILMIALVKGLSVTLQVRGYLFLLGAVLSNASFYTISQKALAQFSIFERTYAMCLSGATVFTLCALAESSAQGGIQAYLTLPFTDTDFFTSAVYLGIGCTTCAFLLSNRSISILGAARTCTFAGLTNIISVSSGVLIMKDHFTPLQAVGTAMALSGIYLVNKTPASPAQMRAPHSQLSGGIPMTEQQPVIAVLRWESGHVPQGLMQLEAMPGNSTNPRSYPFPVKLVEVPGANTETVALHPSQKLLQTMIDLSRKLVAEAGIQAITTSCGFNAIFQKSLAEAVDVPVFSSALLQIPFVQQLVGQNRAVGVITANKSLLTREHLHACGVSDDMNVIILGLENMPEWGKIFTRPDVPFDMEAVSQEILGVAREGVLRHPEIAAIVLECTDLPPYAARIHRELNLPVFDFNSMMGHVAMAVSQLNLYEPPLE